ncbi:MAG TPA: peptidylprolyl isomerase [Fontimonas sp.]
MKRLLRQPLLHFLLLGGLLLGIERQFAPSAAADGPALIRIGGDEIAQLGRDWQLETGVAPTPLQLKASVERHIDDELLMAEALRMELDASDPVARARLLQNLRFVFPQRRASDASLLQEARDLGMSRRDLIVRRRLIQVMERRLAANVAYDEQAFAEYLQQHAQRYGQPARTALRQVYFADATFAAQPDAGIAAAIARTRERLAQDPPHIAGLGDPFLHGQEFPPLTTNEITQRFGPGFAAALQAQDGDGWIGPLRSSYGWHLVEIRARIAAQPLANERSREQALRAWIAAQQPRVLRAQLQQLRARYTVELPADYAQGLVTAAPAGACGTACEPGA